jgi:hypothetical protein
MAKKNSFVLYQNWATLISNLPNEQAGELIKAICSFQNEEEVEIHDQTVKAMYLMILPKLEADAIAYQKTCEQNAANGKKGAAKRWGTDDSERHPDDSERHPDDSERHPDDSERHPDDSERMAKHSGAMAKAWRNIADTDTDTDTDKDSKREAATQLRENPTPKRGKGIPLPTLDECTAFANSNNLSVSPARFFEYYEARDWIDGSGKPVLDWREKMISWHKDNAGKAKHPPEPKKGNQFNNFQHNHYSKEVFEALEGG